MNTKRTLSKTGLKVVCVLLGASALLSISNAHKWERMYNDKVAELKEVQQQNTSLTYRLEFTESLLPK